ncbi:MAG TPA: hypothetical protein VLX09_04095 [Stellaceae bacterium]|nr:hypothetical protein [Stellaceae bacterium]
MTSKRSRGRILLVALTIWALAMVVPDIHRLVRPLGSFGFYSNNDGLITDVQGPFRDKAASPAWIAGLRAGDRLDLAQMRCIPVQTLRCASALAILGGLRLVTVDRHAELVVASSDNRSRLIEITAATRPFSWWVLAVLPFDQLAAVLVILAAAWLVWTRPGGLTWGFFLYVIWFNPGQSYEYYALLQHSPAALLTQNIAGAIAQGVGYAGFLLFALRLPQDQSLPRWRPVERALPAVAILLAVLLVLSNANLFGYPTETITRLGILSGFLVAAGAFAILMVRRNEQPPLDYQRFRWVIWGCVIGLPALILADIGQLTNALDGIWGNAPPREEVWDLVRLVNGVLCLFVFEAVRRPRVVSVAIPLRRVTILGLLLSVPMLFLHEQVDHVRQVIRESLELPGWVWPAIAVIVLFLITRLHEYAVHHADRFFNRSIARASGELGAAILRAQDFVSVEGCLVKDASTALGLASGAIFRDDGGVFRRSSGAIGWDDHHAATLDLGDRILQNAQSARPFDVDGNAGKRILLPDGPMRPVLALPIANRFRCYAVVLYGAHISGNDLNEAERRMLAELADLAAAVFTKLDYELLQRRVASLELERKTMIPASAPTRSASGA